MNIEAVLSNGRLEVKLQGYIADLSSPERIAVEGTLPEDFTICGIAFLPAKIEFDVPIVAKAGSAKKPQFLATMVSRRPVDAAEAIRFSAEVIRRHNAGLNYIDL